MTDNKPLTAHEAYMVIEEYVYTLKEFAPEKVERALDVISQLGEAHAQWPPGRPISEYRAEMGEVLVELTGGKEGLKVLTPNLYATRKGYYKQFWLLPGSEGA